ncbi:MAG: CoA transferase [Candidatus Promineifilaceae bacterium]|nr:CoA transferase [Candidatus Promineifilaceae bacterium]
MEPLENWRVLTLAINIPGPVAAARLTELGASVLKVEPPSGDPLALASPSWYAALHESVVVERVNLKETVGQERLAQWLAETDLLLTASRPASLERLGLAWSHLGRRYPRLCQVAIVGYPPPEADKPGHDLTYQAALGLTQPPELPRTVLADLAGAAQAVSAALAMLLLRERSGSAALPAEQRYTQVALAAAAADFAAPLQHGLTGPDGLLGGLLPGYNFYEASDGWIAVAALERHFHQRLAEALALTAVTEENLAALFRQRRATEWARWAAERDLPLVAVADA